MSCFHVVWGAIISQVRTNKNISTPHKVQHCFVLLRPQLKPSCILHSSSNLHGWRNRSRRPGDRWINVYSMVPERLADVISEVLNSTNLPCFAWIIRSLADRCLDKLWNFCVKQMGPFYTIFYLVLSFFHFVRPLKSLLYCR